MAVMLFLTPAQPSAARRGNAGNGLYYLTRPSALAGGGAVMLALTPPNHLLSAGGMAVMLSLTLSARLRRPGEIR